MKAYLVISGNVQGVGYRFFVKSKADELGVNGFVRNRKDGAVDVFGLFKDEEHLRSFLKAIFRTSSSDFGLHVRGIKIHREDESGFLDFGGFADFQLRL
ncbi:acylphosphatase [Candidatus Micrarchaeota archaeon]|nr:acylphosphatase [Candidatus Micrarchaeota archaeon]